MPRAVRRTAPGEDRGAVAQDDRELGGQARLADPRLSDEGHHVRRRRRFAARERVAQAPQLVVATDQRAVEPAADRRSVRVEALQPEAALAERRRARGVADDPPGWRVDADLAAAPPPGRAAPRRATDSPKTDVVPRRAAATTSPVATPQRARSPSGSSRVRATSSAADRSARCAASSWATGAPKTASTASLRDSTTTPSCSAQTAADASW